MKEELEKLQEEVVASLAASSTEKEISDIRVRFLGRKGSLTQLLKRLGALPETDRREIGRKANQFKEDLEAKIEEVLLRIREREKRESLERERVDVTLPGRRLSFGRKHPITQTLDEMVDIFSRIGFEVVEGPEVELDYYNFEALNIPKGHPAREMQATFFISDEVVLRTHTSPVEVRTMEKQRPPVRIISPGPGLPVRFGSDSFSDVSSGRRPPGGQRDYLCRPERGADGLCSSDVRREDKTSVPPQFFPFHGAERRGRY